MKEKIEQDLREALKAREAVGISARRLLLAEIHNQEIEKRGQLTDDQVLSILLQTVKKHEDSIAQFQAGERLDLVSKEEAELQVVKSYLPEPLNETELKNLIQQIISEIKPGGSQDFGKVMREVMAKVKGRAPGALVSQLVKEELNK